MTWTAMLGVAARSQPAAWSGLEWADACVGRRVRAYVAVTVRRRYLAPKTPSTPLRREDSSVPSALPRLAQPVSRYNHRPRPLIRPSDAEPAAIEIWVPESCVPIEIIFCRRLHGATGKPGAQQPASSLPA
ncbi:hypothetical protein BS50DRAFT_53203 [Corynespora cassiicola Philippines]|uniref:Uncharacterized protein n=1 Tax=Corynespora cassiicola Philippines TaxID=1448308 RepID=A0A2T2NID5_CORCC|nr:hypothetical protein BS50DRAFT_53203 [Corynespora cassiicola Philippines]